MAGRVTDVLLRIFMLQTSLCVTPFTVYPLLCHHTQDIKGLNLNVLVVLLMCLG